MRIELANRLIAAGVPVVVCRPVPNWEPGSRGADVMPPKGWAIITADDCDISGFRPGVDAIAMVGGHGIDVVDVDTKDGGSLENLPPFQSFGETSTPSGGVHRYVRSTGIAKISPLRTSAGHVGDYVGGTTEGGGRLLAFLPGSTRPKYPSGEYILTQDVDLDALLESQPDDDLIAALLGAGGRRHGEVGKPTAHLREVESFLADNSENTEPCQYGRKALRAMIEEATSAVPGDPIRGRHGWAVRSATRAVELARAGCFTAADLDALERTLDRIKPEGGTDWYSVLAWALANADGFSSCYVHGPSAVKRQADPPSKGGEDATGYDPNSLDDAHIAQRLAEGVLAGRFCWAAGLGWLRWDGKRWRSATDKTVAEAIRQTVIRIHADEAKAGVGVARLKALSSLLSAHRIRSLVSLACGILETTADTFDRHPDLLNVGNGVVDLKTGALRPHDSALLLTKLTTVDYDPEAEHPDWSTALHALPPGVATWMQVRLGQAATGHMTPDDLLPVCQGNGANGKSTFLGSVRVALGDHAVTVPERVLMTNPGDHPTELMTLFGARLALIEETPEARHLSVKRLKDTVGTPTMTARRIRQDNVTWKATHSLVLTSNYAPRVDETDHGTWRRLALVRFPYTFGEDTGDPRLRERLSAGLEGQHAAVLAWIVAGARRWYASGRIMPPLPATVANDTDAWRGEADAVHAYIEERVVFDQTSCVLTRELLDDFNDWLNGRGAKLWSDQTLATRFGGHSNVEAHKVTKARLNHPPNLSRRYTSAHPTSGKIRVWQGVRFRTPADDEQDQGGPGSPVNRETGLFTRVASDPRSTPVQASTSNYAITLADPEGRDPDDP